MKKEYQIYAAVVLGFILFIFVYFTLLLSPINKSIADKKKKINELETTLATAKKLASELDYLREKSKLLEMEVSDLQKRLPKNKDIPDLLRRITRNAQKFDVGINNLQPQQVVSKAEYDELPFMMTVTSNFHSLGSFFAEIGQEERLLSVSDLTLNSASGAGETRDTTVTGSFVMIAYMAKGGSQ
jgi:type IV pilus assembly protein PilO